MMNTETKQAKIKIDTKQVNELYKEMQLLANSGVIDNFNRTNVNFPKNPYTNERYQAGRLYKNGHQKGFNETRWLTEAEIKSNGLHLKPDEVTNFFESDLWQNDEYYNKVKFYNVEQLDKASFDSLPADEKPTPNWAKNEIVEKFILAQKVTIFHNSCSNPRYNPQQHTIHMPHPSQYDTAEGYYNDLFHEIAHSTAKQLGREPKNQIEAFYFYRRDELVAELTAMNLCESLKVESDRNKNLAYLKDFLSQFGDEMLTQKRELGNALIEKDKVLDLTQRNYKLAILIENIKTDKTVEEMVSNYLEQLGKTEGKSQADIGTDKSVEEMVSNYLEQLGKSTEKSQTKQVEKVTPAPKESSMEL